MMKSRDMMMNLVAALTLAVVCSGCLSLVKVRLFTSQEDPLKERTLQGEGDQKIALIPVQGVISDTPGFSFIKNKPSMVQEFISQLDLAEKDPDVKAVLLKVDSPGGGVTASDILYHEIVEFKKRSGKKIVVCMMDMATSGGYYISLPADHIVAHPTTVTGSIGVILFRPKVVGLMDKIGVDVNVSKSGEDKDMGSPFRKGTEAETKLFQNLIDNLADRFESLVVKHRKLDAQNLKTVKTARVFLANEALKVGLVDQIGYLDDAVAKTCKLVKIPTDSRLVVYRRSTYPNDNVYNTTQNQTESSKPSLISFGPFDQLQNLSTGFYYIWLPGAK